MLLLPVWEQSSFQGQLGLIMRERSEQVLSESMTPPAFADTNVAFLKKAFVGHQKSEGLNDTNHVLP